MRQTTLRSKCFGFFYAHFLKKIFFILDPETVHDRLTGLGKTLGNFSITRNLTASLFQFNHPSLEQNILGIRFKNPIGLAAGFDKDAQLTDILPSVGFGFAEVGSITGEPCAGNPKPRLWRLKKSQSLLVYYGLKNQGCIAIASRLIKKQFTFPVGISIAKTNSPDTVSEQQGIADYLKAYTTFAQAAIGDYFTINISCPNAFGGEPFTDPEKLDHLLAALTEMPKPKPIFIKLPAELPNPQTDAIIILARKYKLAGFVCTNLAKSRTNPHIKDQNVPENGGMSGKVVQELSDNLIAYIYQKTNGEFIIIGCGGVFSAADAYRKIKLGASLIQLITGMIFNGPQVIGDINRGLVSLLESDGYTSISQAIGTAQYQPVSENLPLNTQLGHFII